MFTRLFITLIFCLSGALPTWAATPWLTVYFQPATTQDGTTLITAGDVAVGGVTQMMDFCYDLNSDGSVSACNGVDSAQMADFISVAHNISATALLSFYATDCTFEEWVNSTGTPISNLRNAAKNAGFDGVNLNVETIHGSGSTVNCSGTLYNEDSDWAGFIGNLWGDFNCTGSNCGSGQGNWPGALITASTPYNADESPYEAKASKFNQINIECYDWEWLFNGIGQHSGVWYNSALTGAGYGVTVDYALAHSGDGNKWTSITSSLLGLGVPAYGYYIPMIAPDTRCGGTGQPTCPPESQLVQYPYWCIANPTGSGGCGSAPFSSWTGSTWSSTFESAYINPGNGQNCPNSDANCYVTFDDITNTIPDVGTYVINNSLGGVMLWSGEKQYIYSAGTNPIISALLIALGL